MHRHEVHTMMNFRRRKVRSVVVAVLATISVPPADAGLAGTFQSDPQRLPVPPQSEVQWVAKDMHMNGVPMTLQWVQSRLAPSALLDYYESQARDSWGSERRRSTNGEWQLLAVKSPRHYVTVQVRATISGSEGTIAINELPLPPAAKLASKFPRPPTSRIVSLQEYDDEGIQSEHISLLSTRGVALEARTFSAQLVRAGWRIVRQQPMQQVAAGVAIEAQRGAEQAFVTLQPHHAQPSLTAVVVVWKKS
jgi:hypothetical protein